MEDTAAQGPQPDPIILGSSPPRDTLAQANPPSTPRLFDPFATPHVFDPFTEDLEDLGPAALLEKWAREDSQRQISGAMKIQAVLEPSSQTTTQPDGTSEDDKLTKSKQSEQTTDLLNNPEALLRWVRENFENWELRQLKRLLLAMKTTETLLWQGRTVEKMMLQSSQDIPHPDPTYSQEVASFLLGCEVDRANWASQDGIEKISRIEGAGNKTEVTTGPTPHMLDLEHPENPSQNLVLIPAHGSSSTPQCNSARAGPDQQDQAAAADTARVKQKGRHSRSAEHTIPHEMTSALLGQACKDLDGSSEVQSGQWVGPGHFTAPELTTQDLTTSLLNQARYDLPPPPPGMSMLGFDQQPSNETAPPLSLHHNQRDKKGKGRARDDAIMVPATAPPPTFKRGLQPAPASAAATMRSTFPGQASSSQTEPTLATQSSKVFAREPDNDVITVASSPEDAPPAPQEHSDDRPRPQVIWGTVAPIVEREFSDF